MGWGEFTIVWSDLPPLVDEVIVDADTGSKSMLVSNEALPWHELAEIAADPNSHRSIKRGSGTGFFVYVSAGLMEDWNSRRLINIRIQFLRGTERLSGVDNFDDLARYLGLHREVATEPELPAEDDAAPAKTTAGASPEIGEETADLLPRGRLADAYISKGALVYNFRNFNPGSNKILKLERDLECRPRILELARIRLEEGWGKRISYYVEVHLKTNDRFDVQDIPEIENAANRMKVPIRNCIGIGTCSRYGSIYPTELDDRVGEYTHEMPNVNTQILYVDSQNSGLDGSQEAVIFFDLLKINYELEALFIDNNKKFDLHFSVGVFESKQASNLIDRRAEDSVPLNFIVSMSDTEGELLYLGVPGIGVTLRKYENADDKQSDKYNHPWLQSTLTRNKETGAWELLSEESNNWPTPDEGAHTADALMCLDFGTSLSSLSLLSFQEGFSNPQQKLVDLGDKHAAPFAGMTAGVRLCDNEISTSEEQKAAELHREKLWIEFKQTPADKRGISRLLFSGDKQQEFRDPKKEICAPDHEPIYFKDDNGKQKAMFLPEFGSNPDCRPDIERGDFFQDALTNLLFPSSRGSEVEVKELIYRILGDQTILLMISMPEAPPVHVDKRYRSAAENCLKSGPDRLAHEHLTVRTISEAKAMAQLILAHRSNHDLRAERTHHKRSRISVFDFGAGTLDIAVIDFDTGGLIDDDEDNILVAPVTRVSQSIRMAGHELDKALLKDIEAALAGGNSPISKAHPGLGGFLALDEEAKLNTIRACKETPNFVKEERFDLLIFPPGDDTIDPGDLKEISSVSLNGGTVRLAISDKNRAVCCVSIDWGCMKTMNSYLRYIGDVVIAGAWQAGNDSDNIDHHLAVVSGRGSIFSPLLEAIKCKLRELTGEMNIEIMDYIDTYSELGKNPGLKTLMKQCGDAIQFAKSAVSVGALLAHMDHYKDSQFIVPLQRESSCTFLDGHNFAVIDGDINGDNVVFDKVRNIHTIAKEGSGIPTEANGTMYLVCGPAGLALAWDKLDANQKDSLLDNFNASIKKVPPQKFELAGFQKVRFEMDRNGENVLAKNLDGGIDRRLPLWPN